MIYPLKNIMLPVMFAYKLLIISWILKMFYLLLMTMRDVH